MFDPEQVQTAARLQAICPGWVIFWSPALRILTAIAGHLPEWVVIINDASPTSLLRRARAIDLAVNIGRSDLERLEVGARRMTEASLSASPSRKETVSCA